MAELRVTVHGSAMYCGLVAVSFMHVEGVKAATQPF